MMSGKTVTRAHLVERIFRKVGFSRTESAELVETVIDEVCNAIERGEIVKLSSFATFQVRHKNERIGRNPKTGEEVPISPRRVVTFKASNVLKQRVLKAHLSRKGQKEGGVPNSATSRSFQFVTVKVAVRVARRD